MSKYLLFYVTGFTTAMIDQGEEELRQPDQCVDSRGMLNATNLKKVFKKLVRKAIRKLEYDRYYKYCLSGQCSL